MASDPLPIYESHASAYDTAAYLPNYSAISFQHLWQYEAQEFCRTSSDVVAVKNVLRLVPPSNAVALLSKREEGWLNTCLQDVCESAAIEKPPCNSPESTAQKIVEITTRRRSLPPWNGDWIIPALGGSTETLIIAEKFDYQIYDVFSRTTLSDWVAWRFGYRSVITNFVDTVIKVRNELIHYAKDHGSTKLTSIQTALPYRQPLTQWILSTAKSDDTSSNPSTILRFITDPIEQKLTERTLPFLHRIQHLLIMEERFRLKIMNSIDIDWSTSFSTDFSLWRSIRTTPRMLAESTTRAVEKLFAGISVGRIVLGDELVKTIGKDWSAFSDDVLAHLNADATVMPSVMSLAELFLFDLRNVHSATAIGLALSRSGFKPSKPWLAWKFIDPSNNFSGCMEFMAKGHCIPYLNRFTMELFILDIRTDEMLRHVCGRRGQDTSWGNLGRREEVGQNIKSMDFETGQEIGHAEKRTFSGISLNCAERAPPTCSPNDRYLVSSPLKRMAPIDKELPDIKRTAVRVNVSHPYFSRNQRHQEPMFCDTNHLALNLQTPSPAVSTDSVIDKPQHIVGPPLEVERRASHSLTIQDSNHSACAEFVIPACNIEEKKSENRCDISFLLEGPDCTTAFPSRQSNINSSPEGPIPSSGYSATTTSLGIFEEETPDSDLGSDRDLEDDSAYESDAESIEFIAPSYELFLEENGRTYHTYGCTEYWGPNDEAAKNQQDLSHRFWTLVLNGNLFTAPLKNPQSILDIGTGTGIWAINIGDKYPSAVVTGIDISAIQPEWVPPNVTFETDDFNSSDYKEVRKYDMIHGRELLGSVLDWPGLFEKCFKALKPGGWLDWAEPSIHLKLDDSLAEEHPLRQWIKTFIDAGEKNGMSFDVSSKLEAWMRGAGFVCVQVKKISVPIGGNTELGRWNQSRMLLGVFDFSARRLANELGWFSDEITVFVACIKAAIAKPTLPVSQDFYFVHGQKPIFS